MRKFPSVPILFIWGLFIGGYWGKQSILFILNLNFYEIYYYKLDVLNFSSFFSATEQRLRIWSDWSKAGFRILSIWQQELDAFFQTIFRTIGSTQMTPKAKTSSNTLMEHSTLCETQLIMVARWIVIISVKKRKSDLNLNWKMEKNEIAAFCYEFVR